MSWAVASVRVVVSLLRGGSTVHVRSRCLLAVGLSRGVRGDSDQTRGQYHGGRLPSSDDSFHSPTVIPPSALDKPSIMKRPTVTPPSALDKPSIMKRYHRRRTCSHTSPRLSPTMVTLHDNRFVECRWWNDGWTVMTVVT